ncbi:DNA polymerase ligase-domain-containing protein [Durotheca rogersii]|uniref:DNA polymerase ligase-domain-containing protein n=1 Tax=Durotheca rogersii TaxID=419775 RepID=UPI0022204783|nr:DNA polymerase ligase-domain-containing protein [Durotheca rogersii]KAI5865868.1 DNA polymerase ligase-domain-containing protein [Durotheca rogersii]
MAAKRRASPELVPNPFIKKRNLEWSIAPSGPARDTDDEADSGDGSSSSSPGSRAAAGPAPAENRGAEEEEPDASRAAELLGRLGGAAPAPFAGGAALWRASWGAAGGAHFVVHQHDHPVAGPHYDLRLQINGRSSASWAVAYGLPGDANSRRPNRAAIETRVHCLTNHLAETASRAAGSLLIWDTGTYAVLPPPRAPSSSSSSSCSSSPAQADAPRPTEQENLARAFRARRIRLQLRGARLPRPYVLSLRLAPGSDAAAPDRGRQRRRRRPGARPPAPAPAPSTSDSDSGASDGDAEVRRTNVYPGAANTIGSVHGRRWLLSLDCAGSGFVRARRGGRAVWERAGDGDGDDGGGNDGEGAGAGRLTFPFRLRGVEVERSVVTGRLAADVLRDEGVVGYVGRRGWRPVLD